MLMAVATGAVAGAGMGYVLQRGQLCFHSMFSSAWAGRMLLLRGWLLGVALASVGLSALYLTRWSSGLNTGLAFRPFSDVAGGLLIGGGMVVASSCASGLFYKLGSGMAGAVTGMAGWALGELAARSVHLPGPTVLPGGRAATFAGVLGMPRLALSLIFLAVVVAALWRWRAAGHRPERWQWDWPRLGAALGAVTVAGWVLARLGGSGFGPSTVGATASAAAGSPDWWLMAFLLGVVAGAAVAARTAGGWRPRGEPGVRYAQLAAGGFLLGAGGWIAGGCNLGHGLSGVAQLNVSSWVAVASMAAGVGLGIVASRAVRGARAVRAPAAATPRAAGAARRPPAQTGGSV
jgi:uncharacterized protein